jgi:hypothetical protein
VADDSLISDELLRQLVGVGQVDLLVGVPTLNHATTIATVIAAVEASFRSYFPRQRTVILHLDGGSTDDTVALAESRLVDPARTVTASHGLRSTHRISTPYHGHPGKVNIVPVMFSAADLLQASTVVILDPDVDNITPQWVAALATPVRDRGFDFVVPAYRRQPAEGLLVTQLLRPLLRALYGSRLREPLVREFGCSGRFAARLAEQLAAGVDVPDGMNLWLTGAALSGSFNVGHARFGSRHVRPDAPRPALPDLFQQIIAAAFTMIDAHAEYCLSRGPTADVPDVGALVEDSAPTDALAPDATRLLASFAEDAQNLDEILRRILSAETFAAVVTAAAATEARERFPDALWASTVAEFLVAYHHGVMRRDHIAQALLPLYVARTGAFLLEHAHSEPEALETALESLSVHFEQARVQIVDRWSKPAVR